KNTPLDSLLVETDAPYLAPPPFRGKRNEPAYVRYVVEKIAEIKGETAEKVAQQTVKNTLNLFKKIKL
ncbi:MAG: TatD family hydrolase, partial [Patescibacteria group bacterium]